MKNQTVLSEFLLIGFSSLHQFQFYLFMIFLLIYLMTLTWNLLIFLLIITDSHLHTPMYFFLSNLACIDICCSSVITPRMLFDLYTQSLTISVSACFLQFSVYSFLASSEIILLAVMSCDRYAAICHPLHYMTIMHWKVCAGLASGVWAVGLVYTICHALYILKLQFCGSNIIHSFFCDLPQLLLISCGDTSIYNFLILLLEGLYSVFTLVVTFGPYINIFDTVLRLQGKSSRFKAFSTCTTHLSVVFLFYGTAFVNYFSPKSRDSIVDNKLLSVCYTIVSPLLNPVIYSLRNKDIKDSLRRTVQNVNK
ncbi:olfactory receptor 5V1-like [Bombina bombina]|uniref:olfactory receptor 5V1-like n=1 Tax=Bombina bombina TaxID=8345 RepID=UPI00235AF85B|nr:olfactory receptor 5V1-like [Bombina bombina]